MHYAALILGLASIGTIVLASRSGAASAQIMSLLMAMLWAAANILATLDASWFRALLALPLIDLPIVCLAFVFWYEGQKRWQGAAATFLALRLPCHLAAGIGDGTAYKHTINALYLAALISISWKGGVDAVVFIIRDYLLRHLHRGMAAYARVVGQEAR